MMVCIGNDWDNVLANEFQSSKYQELRHFLIDEYRNHIIYPSMYDIFTALKLTPYNDTKVVIIGQDPYHEPNQAHGLAFSVLDGVDLPPSLKNIYNEIESELGIVMGNSGNLTKWAEQGVLLLNNVLTVRKGLANSHKGKGWEFITDAIVQKLNERKKPVIFVFWGNNAKSKRALVTNEWHHILLAPHPSPLSAYQGFFGCGHFKRINEILVNENEKIIDWKI